jgi:hypothetical protein
VLTADLPQESFAKCFEELVFPVLFEVVVFSSCSSSPLRQVDAFKPQQCGHWDMWPCPQASQLRSSFIDAPFKRYDSACSCPMPLQA